MICGGLSWRFMHDYWQINAVHTILANKRVFHILCHYFGIEWVLPSSSFFFFFFFVLLFLFAALHEYAIFHANSNILMMWKVCAKDSQKKIPYTKQKKKWHGVAGVWALSPLKRAAHLLVCIAWQHSHSHIHRLIYTNHFHMMLSYQIRNQFICIWFEKSK